MVPPQAIDTSTTQIERIPDLVAGLRRCYESGRTRPLQWRREQLQGLVELVSEHKQELLDALHADFGKPPFEAALMDVAQVKVEAKLALRKLRRWTRPERVGRMPGLGRTRVIREPLGVALIIAPWNYPVGLLLSPAVGALAAGNAMVLKPSELTPHTSRVLAERIPQYVAREAVAVVEGGVPETQALLAERFDHIFYTGNGRVAHYVMEAASKHLTPVTLELGGKSPCIVHEDADIETTARRIAWGKFVNAGQTCIAPDYVLVHRTVELKLLDALGRAIEEFYGADPSVTPHFARIVNRGHHERLEKLLESGRIAFGGRRNAEERYFEPTVLRDVKPSDPVMCEEIFGPILPLIAVDSMDHAIDFVNQREKPLALYLFTKDREIEDAVLEQTSSGGACVNGTLMHIADPRAPFGGVGASGMGAYHGRASFETFSHRKTVMKRGFRLDPKLMYPPYGGWLRGLIRRFS